MHKSLITLFAEKKIILDKVPINSIFHHLKMDYHPDHFDCKIEKEKLKDYPVILYYHKNLKEEFASQYSKNLVNFSQ